MLVQQTIQQSYARQNGVIPQDGSQPRGQRSYSEPRGKPLYMLKMLCILKPDEMKFLMSVY